MDPQGSVVCGADVLYRASSYGVFLMPDGSRRAHYGLDFYAPDGTEGRPPVGWVGRTGSAHGTHAHTHYEWRDRWGRVKNPYAAFLRAQGLPADTRVVRG